MLSLQAQDADGYFLFLPVRLTISPVRKNGKLVHDSCPPFSQTAIQTTLKRRRSDTSQSISDIIPLLSSIGSYSNLPPSKLNLSSAMDTLKLLNSRSVIHKSITLNRRGLLWWGARVFHLGRYNFPHACKYRSQGFPSMLRAIREWWPYGDKHGILIQEAQKADSPQKQGNKDQGSGEIDRTSLVVDTDGPTPAWLRFYATFVIAVK